MFRQYCPDCMANCLKLNCMRLGVISTSFLLSSLRKYFNPLVIILNLQIRTTLYKFTARIQKVWVFLHVLELFMVSMAIQNADTAFFLTSKNSIEQLYAGTQYFIWNAENRKAPKTEHFFHGCRLYNKARVLVPNMTRRDLNNNLRCAEHSESYFETALAQLTPRNCVSVLLLVRCASTAHGYFVYFLRIFLIWRLWKCQKKLQILLWVTVITYLFTVCKYYYSEIRKIPNSEVSGPRSFG